MGLTDYDIMLLGDYFFDQIFSGLPNLPVLGREMWATQLSTTGGGMFITAAALTRLKVKVGWAACFGNDSYSRIVYDLTRKEGIDLSLAKIVEDRPFRRVTTAIPLHDERAFVSYTDPDPNNLQAHWLHCLEESSFRHVHLGGYMPQDQLRPILERVHAQHATISMDVQDGEHLLNPAICRQMLSQVDILIPNAREAQIITETSDPKSAVRELMRLVKVAVVKDGAHGAWAGHQDEIIFVPAVKLGHVVDTTGAGDCFNAGFLMGYLVAQAPLRACLLYGNICGGLSVTDVGGATAAPSYEELMSLYQEYSKKLVGGGGTIE